MEWPGVDKSSEVGESAWMVREDQSTFNNDMWDFDRDVLVTWPCDTKVIKKIVKSTVDPHAVKTTCCVARVIEFSGKFLNNLV